MLGVLVLMLSLATGLFSVVANISHMPIANAAARAGLAVPPRLAATFAEPRSAEGFSASVLNAPIAPLEDEESITPPSELNVKIELVDEGINDEGRWFQTLRITINSGGTLADASYVLYGDESYYQDLFELARQRNPELKSPANIRAGEQFEVEVDPTAAYVIRETSWDAVDEKTVYKFFNGVEMSIYGKKSGLIRTVDFPDDSRANVFSYRIGAEILQIAPGSRLAEYRYRQGDAFAQVVKQIYGAASARALQDFIVKTGYTPDRWPPKEPEKKRIILSTMQSWTDDRLQPLSRVPKGPAMNEQMRALMDTRATAGIYLLVTEDLGITYRIQITNPNITAKDVSKLLFGTEERYLDIANQAGIVPTTDEDGKIVEGFNPPLLGRSFDLFVEYNEERFPDGQPVRDDKAARTITRLVNGTYVEEYDRAKGDDSGLQRTVYYPTGYKKIFYRANELIYTLADFLFFVSHSGRVGDGPVAREQQVEFIGRMIWDWAPGMPRDPGDIAEDFRIYDTKSGKLIEVVVAPRPQTGILATLIYDVWLGNPLVTALSLVAFATGLIVLGTLFVRRRG